MDSDSLEKQIVSCITVLVRGFPLEISVLVQFSA